MGLFVVDRSATEADIDVVVPAGRSWKVHAIHVELPGSIATYCGVSYEVPTTLGNASVFYTEFSPDMEKTGRVVIQAKGIGLPEMAIPAGGKIRVDAPEASGGEDFRIVLVIED